LKEIGHGEDVDAVPGEGAVSLIHAIARDAAGAQLFSDTQESTVVATVPPRRRLDLYCHKAPGGLTQEVDLDAVIAAPEVKGVVQAQIGAQSGFPNAGM